MRLDKLLANSGFGTRKEVKKLLKEGIVKANDTVEKDGKRHVDPAVDVITVGGDIIQYEEYVYFIMNKPSGVISATEDETDPTVLEVLEWEDASRVPFPVGRLDKDTEGLLLLTNDGTLAHRLTSPKHHVDKIYEAHLAEPIKEGDREAFYSGILLDDGYVTKPARLEPSSESDKIVYVTLREGKYHQVKRMFAARGNRVVYLKRVEMGPLKLDEEELPVGTYRDLSEEEVEVLYKVTGLS
ncbi:pseudouridine synthase [Bacillus fonticola]|uniref:pseudouridine synthase n=1 Tax=Bacillus fonticola TaxID=2728853 RepID=UPI001473E852|nr:pseudouridine synthase [Bacillus fonticola]